MKLKQTTNSLQARVCLILIVVITFFAFLPSLKNGFTNWDDKDYVTGNPLVTSRTIQWKKIATKPVSLHYHPLTILSLALNYQFGNINPLGYHAVNLLLHILNTVLVFLFVYRLTKQNLLMAAIVALFFGIHPMHVESVAWVSGRKDVLYVFFFMVGLVAYLRYLETEKTKWYVVTVLLFIFSCLSKGVAVIFPFVLLLIDDFSGRKWGKNTLIGKIPFFIVAAIISFIEVRLQSGNSSSIINNITLWQRVVFASYSAVMYVAKFFAPINLSAFYPFPAANNIPVVYYLSPFILLMLLSALIYLFVKKQKIIVFGLLFYFITIALVVQFFPIDPGIIPDRYSYLSYIGLLFIVAYLIDRVWQNKNREMVKFKYLLITVVFIVAMFFSYQTYSRTQVWQNSETLWTDVIEHYPDDPTGYSNRGMYYNYVTKDINNAISDFKRSINIDPAFKIAYVNLGLIYYKSGNYDSGLYFFNNALKIDSTLVEAYTNRGALFLDLNNNKAALADFNKAIYFDSAQSESYSNRGVGYENMGDTVRAIADFNKAIELDSDNVDPYNNLGLIYLYTGQLKNALADFRKLFNIDPGYVDGFNDWGVYYFRTGLNDSAIIYFNKAIALKPASGTYYYNRGLCYVSTGQLPAAIDDFTKSIQLLPRNINAYNERGICYNRLNDFKTAISDFNKVLKIDTAYTDVYSNIAQIYMEAGKPDSAVVEISKAIALKPLNVTYYFNRGIIYMNSGKTAMAIDDYNKAISLSPNAPCFYNRGFCYRQLKQYQKAIDDFTEGIKLKPVNADIYYYERGICYDALQKYNNAITDFSSAIDINKTVADYYFKRSETEKLNGQAGPAAADAMTAKQLQQKTY